jgi:hypothetical protein
MPRDYEHLTEDEVAHFLERGHVVLHDCFPRELAEEWKALAFRRLGYDPHDSSTWEKGRIHMPTMTRVPMGEFAPRAWAAACELLGGEERVVPGCTIGDGFIVNFHDRAEQPWQAPSAQSPGWHKDGDFFRHFLDSPEQGLLTLVIWSDIDPRGGGTFVACDSVGPVARYLADHPEGVLPTAFPTREIVSQCRDFIECTGRAGDIVLLHPFILHASSPNPSGRPRFLTNPPIHLKEPMRFDRPRGEEFSLVERAVLQGLGVERLEFRATGERERIVPERVRRQQQMLEEEKQRLAAVA